MWNMIDFVFLEFIWGALDRLLLWIMNMVEGWKNEGLLKVYHYIIGRMNCYLCKLCLLGRL